MTANPGSEWSLIVSGGDAAALDAVPVDDHGVIDLDALKELSDQMCWPLESPAPPRGSRSPTPAETGVGPRSTLVDESPMGGFALA